MQKQHPLFYITVSYKAPINDNVSSKSGCYDIVNVLDFIHNFKSKKTGNDQALNWSVIQGKWSHLPHILFNLCAEKLKDHFCFLMF